MKKFFRERKLLVLVISYLFLAWIVAGDGGGPAALLLFFGVADEWRPGQIIGWASLVILMLSRVGPFKVLRTKFQSDLIVAVGLYTSYLAFAYAAYPDSSLKDFVTAVVIGSVPFQIAFVHFWIRTVVDASDLTVELE